MDKSVVIPYLPDLASPWCIEQRAGRYLYMMLNRYVASGNDLRAIHPDAEIADHADDMERANKRYVSWYNDDIAVVEVNGTLMKNSPPSMYAGKAGITYPVLVQALTDLVENSQASKVILKISSYGGSAAGAIQTMDAIRDLQQQKPIIAFIDDYACSGGYFLASQCTEIVSAQGADIGSIGVLMVLTDDSQRLEDMGLKLTVVSSGEYKGLGADGKVTQKLVDEQQEYVDSIHENLIQRVQSARALTDDDIETVTTGKLYGPDVALNYGLIDQISNWHEIVDIKSKSDTYQKPNNPQPSPTNRVSPTGENVTMSDELKIQVDALTKRIDETEVTLSKNQEQITQVQAERDTAVTERDTVIRERDAAVTEREKAEQQHAALVQEDAQRQLEYRQKACTSWVVQQHEKGILAPAAAPKLNALLSALTPVTEDIEISYTDNAGTVQTEKGQLYELAQQAIEDALISSNPEADIQFEEKAHSRISEEEQAKLDAAGNPYEKRLQDKGVKLDGDQPLAKVVEAQSKSRAPNRTGITSMLSEPV